MKMIIEIKKQFIGLRTNILGQKSGKKIFLQKSLITFDLSQKSQI
ncbi:MAG: hypothetical protein RLZ95_769 [Bacteroidota bacterium]|jgi:hypothetical protein